MKLICYADEGFKPYIRPAILDRDWMDASPQRFAYRCLPLNIANCFGWEILCTADFEAVWNGGDDKTDATVRKTGEDGELLALSHFGVGVITFHLRAMFATDPEWDLFVTGPINRIKDGIQSLTGVVETDWSPYGFTMNWRFTRPNARIRFAKGEPFCHIFPVKRGYLEEITPEFYPASADPERHAAHLAWIQSRNQFNIDLAKEDSEARKQKWQKFYQTGIMPDGSKAPTDTHHTKLRLAPFQDGEKL